MAQLRQPRTVREIRVFTAAGELGLPYLTFGAKKPEAVLAASVEELIRIGTEDALTVLEGYAEASADGRWPRVLAAIAKGWDSETERDDFVRRITRLSVPADNALIDLGPVATWESLEFLELTISGRTSLKGLERLPMLREIRIYGIERAVDMNYLGMLRNVSKIALCGLSGEFDLSSLPQSKQLHDLELVNFASLLNPESLCRLNLTNLTISSCRNLPFLAILGGISGLTSLRIRDVQVRPQQLAEVGSALQLTALELSGLTIERPPEEAKSDWHVNVDDDEKQAIAKKRVERAWKKRRHEALIVDVSWISRMKDLETLTLDANDRVTDFNWLKDLPKLTTLTLQNLGVVRTLEFLVPLRCLKAAYLQNVPANVPVPESVKRKVKEIQTAIYRVEDQL